MRVRPSEPVVARWCGLGTSGQSIQPSDAADQRTGDAPGGRPDTAASVVLTMRQLAVAGLPRNYELFYEAVTYRNSVG